VSFRGFLLSKFDPFLLGNSETIVIVSFANRDNRTSIPVPSLFDIGSRRDLTTVRLDTSLRTLKCGWRVNAFNTEARK